MFFYGRHVKYARRLVQFAVGLYMLLYLGVLRGENMQIEGFWYYLFSGVFEAATIHYAVAKIFGPLLFGRGWCGYACWTAMVLDLLPFRVPRGPEKARLCPVHRVRRLSRLCGRPLPAGAAGRDKILFWSFLAGNLLYYAAGAALAFGFRDNRAFCKYLCPITVFLKPASYFSLLRVKNDTSRCVSCGRCRKVCPMDVDMVDNSRGRKNGTECILCFQCMEECPQKALHV